MSRAAPRAPPFSFASPTTSATPRGYARNVPITSGSSPASAIHAERSPWLAAVWSASARDLELGDHERARAGRITQIAGEQSGSAARSAS